MFSNNDKPKRGRPPGRTERGEQTRQLLYDTALQQFAEHGYEAATMRRIASAAGVSPGLLYRYFPNKMAVVLALYEVLSAEFAQTVLPQGNWRERALHATRASLAILDPHRQALQALTGTLVGPSSEQGLFSPATAFSRERVQGVFHEAVCGATHAPSMGPALSRLLYLAHLAAILTWLMDRSEGQWASQALLAHAERGSGLLAAALRLPGSRALVEELDRVVWAALLGER